LEGLLQENGPFLWNFGTFKPVQNPWTWVRLANMLWVEQPVGTGFTQGRPTEQNEEQVAKTFISWFKNFIDTFGLQGKKIYIAGESYAGFFVPYIADAMFSADDQSYYDVRGTMIYEYV
jgi:carboxypeptidase D